MKRSLEEAGFEITDEMGSASAVIVNTCSFIQSATEESIDAVFEALGISDEKGRHIPVIVAGCMPARYGSDLEESLDEVSAFVPCSKESDIASVVMDCLAKADVDGGVIASDGGAIAVGRGAKEKSSQGVDLPDDPSELDLAFPPDSKTDERCFAYVKISDGCDRWCSYCTIPSIRGRYRSFSFDSIADEVDRLVSEGKKEIVLIGQDTGRWGSDLSDEDTLATLLARLCAAYRDIWFRVMYIQPEGVTDDLLDVMSQNDNVCSYLDIPLQHVCSSILKKMNRSGSEDAFVALVEHAKEKVPDLTLRTTLIAGFPGESEADLAALEDFVSRGLFDYVGVFAYSQEEGTRAAELDGQIPEDEKAYRAQRIRDIADAVSAAKIAERVGGVETILVEGVEEDGQLFGRTQRQAPEVDGITFVDGGSPGSFVSGRITDTLFYDMEAEV